MQRSYLIGAGAGLVSALLFGAAAAATPLAGMLLYLAPLPLCLAGLGWGAQSSLLGAIVGSLLLGAGINPAVGIVFALLIGAPIALACHLLLLSRPAPVLAGGETAPRALEWYPPGRVVGWTAVIAGVLSTLMILALGYDSESFRESIRTMLHSHAVEALDHGGALFTEENINRFSTVMARALPAAFAIIWATISLFNLWISGLILEASHHALRPWPQLDALELPNGFFFAFVVSLIACFLPGTLGLIGTAFAGALLLGFVLQGLAVVHAATRSMPWRGLLLGAVYVGIFLLGWIAIVLAIIGVAEPMLDLRGRAARNGNTTPD